MYVALIEVAPINARSLGEGVSGGVVRCYTPATDGNDALQRIEATLAEANVRLVEVEWCVDSEEVDWEHTDSKIAESCMAAARVKNGPVLGEFQVWGTDEE